MGYLIAAAPELYSECQKCDKFVHSTDLYAALAKAEGRTA